MPLTNLDYDTLYLKTAALKSLAARATNQVVCDPNEVLTLCNELLGLLDQMPAFEQGMECVQLVKNLHNFTHNMRGHIW